MISIFQKKTEKVVEGLISTTGGFHNRMMEILKNLAAKDSDIDPFEVAVFSMSFISLAYVFCATHNDKIKVKTLDQYTTSIINHLISTYGTASYDAYCMLQLYKKRYPVHTELIHGAVSKSSKNSGLDLLLTLYEYAVNHTGTPPIIKIGIYQIPMTEYLLESIETVPENC